MLTPAAYSSGELTDMCVICLLPSLSLFPNSLSYIPRDHLSNKQPASEPLSQDLLSVEPKSR